jgi:hypothetical protein
MGYTATISGFPAVRPEPALSLRWRAWLANSLCLWRLRLIERGVYAMDSDEYSEACKRHMSFVNDPGTIE